MADNASPVIGAGVAVGRIEQLFLLALGQNKSTPADLSAHVWHTLSMQGQRILKDGKALESADENIAHITGLAQTFLDKRLGILKALEIA